MTLTLRAAVVVAMSLFTLSFGQGSESASLWGCDVWHCLGGDFTCPDPKGKLQSFCENACPQFELIVCKTDACSAKQLAVMCVTGPPD
jgi:hypothetical protein